MNNFNEVLEKVTDFLKSEARTETIVGTQFKLGEFTCVPVMSVGIGIGGGEGEGNQGKEKNEGKGFGGGAGIGLGPLGFLVTKGDEIQFISARSKGGLSSAFEKLPDLIEKMMDKSKSTEKI